MDITLRKVILNLRIALRSLCSFRIRSLLAVAGVFLGTVSLVVVANVSEALSLKTLMETEKLGKNLLIVRSGLMKRFHVRIRLFSEATNLTLNDARIIKERITGVEDVMPGANRIFPVRYQNNTLPGVLTVGTTINFPEVRNFYPALGRFFTEDENTELARVVVLGASVSERLFRDENPVGKYIYLYRAPCKVIGVMEPKGVDISGVDQDDQILMPINTYLRRFVNKTNINMIHVKVKDDSLIHDAKGRIEDLLRMSHNIRAGKEDDFTVIDMRDVAALKAQALRTVKTLGRIAGAVAFMIGGMGILSIMILIVNERKIEIGIRRAVGSTKRNIITQFLLESTFIALSGGLAGITTAIAISTVLFLMLDFPFSLSLLNMLIAFFSSVLIGLSAGVYPSYKATTFQPVEVLKE